MAAGRSFRRLVDQSIQQQRPIGLDASALLEFFSGGSQFGSLVAQILEDMSIPVVYSTLTISEVLVRPAKAGDDDLVLAIRAGLENRENSLIVDFDVEQAVEAAYVRATTNLKLPNSAVVAAARSHNAIGIIGADRKWLTRDLGVPFYYLPDMQDLA